MNSTLPVIIASRQNYVATQCSTLSREMGQFPTFSLVNSNKNKFNIGFVSNFKHPIEPTKEENKPAQHVDFMAKWEYFPLTINSEWWENHYSAKLMSWVHSNFWFPQQIIGILSNRGEQDTHNKAQSGRTQNTNCQNYIPYIFRWKHTILWVICNKYKYLKTLTKVQAVFSFKKSINPSPRQTNTTQPNPMDIFWLVKNIKIFLFVSYIESGHNNCCGKLLNLLIVTFCFMCQNNSFWLSWGVQTIINTLVVIIDQFTFSNRTQQGKSSEWQNIKWNPSPLFMQKEETVFNIVVTYGCTLYIMLTASNVSLRNHNSNNALTA